MSGQETRGASVTATATICNKRGLHARAAAKFVKLVAQYDAQVLVSRAGNEVSGLSIMGLMMLAAGPGCPVDIAASGNQAAEVVAAIVELIENKFDED